LTNILSIEMTRHTKVTYIMSNLLMIESFY